MFLKKATKGHYVKIASKVTGVKTRARLMYRSSLGTKFDVFVMEGVVVFRDSLRRRYVEL